MWKCTCLESLCIILTLTFITCNATQVLDVAIAPLRANNTDGPGPRTGAQLKYNPDGTLSVIGGFLANGSLADQYIWKLNLDSSKWTKVNSTNNLEVRAYSCFAQPTSYPQYLWVFGGYNSTTEYNNQLLILNNTGATYLPALVGPSISNPACAVLEDNSVFYVYGGNKNGSCSNSFYAFNQANNEWTNVTTVGAPYSEGSFAAVYGTNLILFGGECDLDYSSYVYRFDFLTSTWSRDTPTNLPPTGRKDHASIIDGDLLIVYGGQGNNTTFGDLWTYNLTSYTWKQHLISNITSRHSAAIAINNNRIFIYGGINNNHTLQDLFQVIIEADCLSLNCSTCAKKPGCGWCNSNGEGYQCVGGTSMGAYVEGTCPGQTSLTVQASNCPELGFPSWAIALAALGGLIIVLITIFGILRVLEKNRENQYSSLN